MTGMILHLTSHHPYYVVMLSLGTADHSFSAKLRCALGVNNNFENAPFLYPIPLGLLSNLPLVVKKYGIEIWNEILKLSKVQKLTLYKI